MKRYITKGYDARGLPLKRIGDDPPEGVGSNGVTVSEPFLNRPHANPTAAPPAATDSLGRARFHPDVVARSARPLYPSVGTDHLTFADYNPWRGRR